jgi:aspartate kinase
MNTVVMKFGGASVQTPESFSHLARIVHNKKRSFQKIIIVISAMGKTTNHLIKLAHKINENPCQRELDMLVTVGERISSSLMSLSLHNLGLHAKSFTGSQAGIITTNEHNLAKIIDVRPLRLKQNLEKGTIVVVAGFQGVSFEKEITTLGRGGSDTTAVALGIALQASRIEFYKDVQSIYASDPKKTPNAKALSYLHYSEAIDLLTKTPYPLHPRAIALARNNNLPLHFRSFLLDWGKQKSGTLIAGHEKELDKKNFKTKPSYEKHFLSNNTM